MCPRRLEQRLSRDTFFESTTEILGASWEVCLGLEFETDRLFFEIVYGLGWPSGFLDNGANQG